MTSLIACTQPSATVHAVGLRATARSEMDVYFTRFEAPRRLRLPIVTVEEPKAQGIRWWLVLSCTAAGGVAIWVTFKIAGPDSREDIAVAFMVEAAAALFLLAFFFFLERSFTTRVTSTVVREVRDRVVAPLEARVDNIATEIANLQREVDVGLQEQTARHHDLVMALDPPTAGSVGAALSEATRLNAIAGQVTVQANEDPHGIWVTFSYGAHFRGRDRLEDDQLLIQVWPLLTRRGPGLLLIEDFWGSGEQLSQVALRLSDRLRKNGARGASNTPDWTVAMRNLQRSLDVALPVEHGGWHLSGALHELVGEDWAITTAGIEYRDLGVVVAVEAIPRRPFPFGRRAETDESTHPTEWDPGMPDGADPDEWALVLSRGRAALERPGLRA
ncbi:hypothetical protein ACFQX7_27065 [Luedemannella flava]